MTQIFSYTKWPNSVSTSVRRLRFRCIATEAFSAHCQLCFNNCDHRPSEKARNRSPNLFLSMLPPLGSQNNKSRGNKRKRLHPLSLPISSHNGPSRNEGQTSQWLLSLEIRGWIQSFGSGPGLRAVRVPHPHSLQTPHHEPHLRGLVYIHCQRTESEQETL